MWIIPKNHPLYSAYAQEFLASKEGLAEHLSALVGDEAKPSLMWRSKPSSLKTWCARWSKVFWLQRLFGRTLKPSMRSHFETALTGLLAATHASRSACPESKPERKTHDTCGHTSEKPLKQLSLLDVFSKTSPIILTSDTRLSGASYKKWVIALRKEYTQRKKSVLRTGGSGCLSSESWGAPRVATNLGLKMWPTPTTAEAGKIGNQPNYGQTALSNHPAIVGQVMREKSVKDRRGVSGQPVQEKSSMNGKRPALLNPVWVAQLMGTTLEKTFFVCTATELSSKQLS